MVLCSIFTRRIMGVLVWNYWGLIKSYLNP